MHTQNLGPPLLTLTAVPQVYLHQMLQGITYCHAHRRGLPSLIACLAAFLSAGPALH